MKTAFHCLAGFGSVVAILATSACTTASPDSTATAPPQPTFSFGPGRTFATPPEAVNALRTAAELRDKTALREIFGPGSDKLASGDSVADDNALATFAQAISELCRLSYEGGDEVVLNIGAQDWPFPIPLVKKDGGWFFDTDAGLNEVINRRVGENELTAIGVCRTYVDAQREYASEDRNGDGVLQYARRIKSTTGKMDGLYWEAASDQEPSPFGPLIASARAEGYAPHQPGDPPQPFHGYRFKLLTAQGPHAPGGAYNYIINNNMIAGFALVAYPDRWGDSGVMTFMVNQQGKVYQCNLGPKTSDKVAAMSRFDPDSAWTPVAPAGTY